MPPLPPAQGRRWPFLRLLRSELGLTFRRPRNLVMLGVLALVPVILGVVLRAIGADGGEGGMGGLLTATLGNSLMLTFFALSILTTLLMPIAVSVVAGDAIAGRRGRAPCATCWPLRPVAPGCWRSSSPTRRCSAWP